MTYDYTRPKATAERLIAKFGKNAVLQQYTNRGTPYSPTRTPSNPVAIKVVDFEQLESDREGSLVGTKSRVLYISTSAGVTPQKQDEVVLDGSTHEIVTVAALKPGDIDLMWEVMVRS